MQRIEGGWAWLIQRITGLALVVILVLHIWATHFANSESLITFSGVQMRLSTVLYILVDWLLLSFGLYHGLNGVRNIVLDYGISEGRARVVTWLLLAIGLVALVYGGYGLAAFMTGRPA